MLLLLLVAIRKLTVVGDKPLSVNKMAVKANEAQIHCVSRFSHYEYSQL